jgi:hypothetical protein
MADEEHERSEVLEGLAVCDLSTSELMILIFMSIDELVARRADTHFDDFAVDVRPTVRMDYISQAAPHEGGAPRESGAEADDELDHTRRLPPPPPPAPGPLPGRPAPPPPPPPASLPAALAHLRGRWARACAGSDRSRSPAPLGRPLLRPRIAPRGAAASTSSGAASACVGAAPGPAPPDAAAPDAPTAGAPATHVP